MWQILYSINWVEFSKKINIEKNKLYYHIPKHVCDSISSNFYDSFTFFNTCETVRKRIREGFDEWSYNTELLFKETSSFEMANIIFYFNDIEKVDVSATTKFITLDKVSVTIDQHVCWHNNTYICKKIMDSYFTLCIVLAITWAFTLVVFYKPVRFISTTVFFYIPTSYFVFLRSCANCHSFKHTIMHEVGHILGLGHTNEDGNLCGCGEYRVPCAVVNKDAVMKKFSQNNQCLDRDDVNGVNSLYAKPCTEQLVCYHDSNFSLSPLLSVFVVAFIISVFLDILYVIYKKICKSRFEKRVKIESVSVQGTKAQEQTNY